jgi:hypothetical protein
VDGERGSERLHGDRQVGLEFGPGEPADQRVEACRIVTLRGPHHAQDLALMAGQPEPFGMADADAPARRLPERIEKDAEGRQHLGRVRSARRLSSPASI